MRERVIGSVFIAIAIAWLIAAHARYNGIFDDAFITYRYSYNLIEGRGFVYNAGENVLGTTAPAYGLLLAVVAAPLGGEAVPQVARWLNIVLMIGLMFAVGWAASALIRTRRWLVMGLMALLVASDAATVRVMLGGMEAPLFLLMLTLSFGAMLHRRYVMSALIAGWLVWIRPEGVFWIGLLGLLALWLVWRKQLTLRQAAMMVLALVVPNLLYAGILTAVYGAPVPQSVLAKSAGLYPFPRFTWGVTVLWYLARPWIVAFTETALAALALTLFNSILLIIGMLYSRRISPYAWLGGVFTLMAAAFYLSSDTLVFEWYHALYTLPFTLWLCAGLVAITVRIVPAGDKAKARVTSIAALLVGLVALAGYIMQIRSYPQEARNAQYVYERELAYYEAIETLQALIPQGATIAMPEIGVLGFYLPHNPILDTAGLVSPQAVDYFPIPRSDLFGGVDPDLIRAEQPAYIVTLRAFLEYSGELANADLRLGDPAATFVNQADLQAQYDIIYRQEMIAFGEPHTLLVYERQSD